MKICAEFVTWVSFHKRRSFSTLVSSLSHPRSRYLIFKTWYSTVFQLLYDEAKSHLPNIEQVNQLANSFIREAKVQKDQSRMLHGSLFPFETHSKHCGTAANEQWDASVCLFFFWTGRNNFWPRWVTLAILGHSGPDGSLRLFWTIVAFWGNLAN